MHIRIPSSQADCSGTLEFSEINTKLRQRIDVQKYRAEKRAKQLARQRMPAPRLHSDKTQEEASSLMTKLRKALAANLRRTMDLMRSWDADGSGFIDRGEFAQAVRKLVPDVDSATAEALFDMFDTDRSGTLEFPELHNRLRAARGGASSRREHAHKVVTSRMRAMQDDVIGRVRIRPEVDRQPTMAHLPTVPTGPRPSLPPKPTLPMTSPARHRRVGRRMPLNARRLDGPSAPAALPPREKDTLPSITSHRATCDYFSPVGNAFPAISNFSFESGFR